MSKYSKSQVRLRRLSDEELLDKFGTDLNTLIQMAKIYDGGYHHIALSMTTLIYKILTENNAAVKLRGNLRFSSPDFGDETRMLNALHRLVSATVEGSPPILKFVPDFYFRENQNVKSLIFREWWNRDVVYRASAALPGTPAGMIPVNGSPSVPFEERETLTRRAFVELIRNKVDAHQDENFPIILDELEESLNFGSFSVNTQEGKFSTHDGTLITEIGPVSAMLRQISHELLEAYGKSDPIPDFILEKFKKPSPH